MTQEEKRLQQSRSREKHWKRWGPYLSERAWGTVREDYSADGEAWDYLPHEHARSRAYRWNEDGIAGICDRHQVICFAIALWNGQDPFLKLYLHRLSGRAILLTFERGGLCTNSTVISSLTKMAPSSPGNFLGRMNAFGANCSRREFWRNRNQPCAARSNEYRNLIVRVRCAGSRNIVKNTPGSGSRSMAPNCSRMELTRIKSSPTRAG